MPRIIGRRSVGLLLALAMLLGGCSLLRLSYEQGPTLLYWRLDRWVGFTPAQAPRVREAIAHWFEWHRREELPRYAAALARLQQELLQDATAPQACRWLHELAAWRDAAWQQALPLLAPLARELQADQLARLAQQWQRDDDALRRDILPDHPAERLQAQVQRTVQRAQRLYGRLDAPQRHQLAQALAEAGLDPQAWWAERQRRQADLLDTLAQLRERHAGGPDTLAALQAVYQRAVNAPTSSLHRDSKACELLARLHNLTTTAQRRTAQQRLRDWEADLRALAREQPASAQPASHSWADTPRPR